jgi:hypothetical protein
MIHERIIARASESLVDDYILLLNDRHPQPVCNILLQIQCSAEYHVRVRGKNQKCLHRPRDLLQLHFSIILLQIPDSLEHQSRVQDKYQNCSLHPCFSTQPPIDNISPLEMDQFQFLDEISDITRNRSSQPDVLLCFCSRIECQSANVSTNPMIIFSADSAIARTVCIVPIHSRLNQYRDFRQRTIERLNRANEAFKTLTDKIHHFSPYVATHFQCFVFPSLIQHSI